MMAKGDKSPQGKQSSIENTFFITGKDANTTNYGGLSAKSKESNMIGVGITQAEFLHLIQDLED